MLYRILCVCLFLCLCTDGLPLSCKWMEHKFKQHNLKSLVLLETMANNSTNTTEDADVGEDAVSFPEELYNHASEASAEDKLKFIVQVLDEMVELFDEDRSSVSWEESAVDGFLTFVHRQAHGLRSCIVSHKKKNKRLHHYFNRLSGDILGQMSHSAEAWELIRKELRIHLLRVDRLAATFTTN